MTRLWLEYLDSDADQRELSELSLLISNVGADEAGALEGLMARTAALIQRLQNGRTNKVNFIMISIMGIA